MPLGPGSASLQRYRVAETIARIDVPDDLSPLFHPPIGRVLASFEPCWLGSATGRGAGLNAGSPGSSADWDLAAASSGLLCRAHASSAHLQSFFAIEPAELFVVHDDAFARE
jgi:hypothetical protein